RIEDYLKKLVNPQSQLPAISATIYYKDKVLWSGHYGTKIAENKTPPNDDTRYRIGSITKVFPVIMLYKMYQDGLIDSLDDPLSKYAPDFHMNNPFTEENITLRQIANQLSGLPREAPCGACLNETTSSEQLALLRNRSLVVEPGTVPSYSNLGYALLGRLLTEMPKVNMTFEDWTRNKILIPLGLNNTGFRIDKEVEQDMAPSYNSLGNRVPFMDIKWLAPAGQMYSSPRDMALFGMYLNAAKKQSVLQTKYWREILSPSDIAPDGQTLWGSPWEMIFHENFLVRGKGGAIDGYSAMVSVVPEIQLGFNVFINAAYHFKEGTLIANTILDYVYREFLPVFNRTLFEVGGRLKFNNATMYIGTYNITKTSELTGEIESKYQATIDDHNYTLLYTENNKKTFLYDTEVPLLLRAAKDTSSCLESQLGNRAQFYFSPAVEGVSPGLLVPGWGITGVRV
ncbi:putative beta-lactamase-like 1, partial [Nematostella vectensis]|uniref:putative beta-lactamase-like 1 n=1 Tax=Nematostella vectensis TaxID=45351 RepID=UPI00207785D5